jgi:hypothetical protein
MRRPLRLLSVLVLVAVSLGGLAFSSASFRATKDNAQAASADHVRNWLSLHSSATRADACSPAPGYAGRRGTADPAATGSDYTLAADLGKRGITTPVGETVECVLTLETPATLPEGRTQLDVTLDVDNASGVAGQPVASALVTPVDGSGPGSPTVTLGAGELRAVRLVVRTDGLPADTSFATELSVTVTFAGNATAFLRYSVPVTVCTAELAGACS